MPVRARRRRGPRARAGARARARGYDAELISVPFKWYPKERDPAARGGVAAARPEREQRAADRSRDRVEVPDLLRASPEQGRLADPPVPRRLRAVRHALQRLRPQRGGRRAARHAHPPRHRDARRVPAHLRQRAEHGKPGAEIQRLRGRGAVPSSQAGGAARGRRAVGDFVLSVGRIESVKRVDLLVSAMARVDKPIRLVVAGDGHPAGQRRARGAPRPAWPIVSISWGRSKTSSCSRSTAIRWRCSIRPLTRISAMSRSRRSSPRKPVVTAIDSGGPNEFVDRRRQRLRARAGARRLRRRHQRARRATGTRGLAWVTPATTRARTITWDGVIEKLVS